MCCTGGVERALHLPQVPWLHQRQPRVLRRKRDCTLALLLTTSTGATSPCTSEEEGLHSGPPPHNVGEYLGGRGTGPPPHNVGDYLGGGGTGPPHNAGDYLGGGGTGPPPHNSGEYVVYNSASCKEDGPLWLVQSA